MATDVELSRLADMTHALRPDWPARSVRTLLERRMRDRAYADLAVALAVIACDPTSETAARVEQPGPWWTATRANRPHDATFTPGPGDDPACQQPGHEHERAAACRACAGERLAGDQPDRELDDRTRRGLARPAPSAWRTTTREDQP
jgi:hypothetical protein